MILGIKLGRRLIAVSAFEDERFVFQDSRFVPSRRQAATGLERYFCRIIEQTQPKAIYAYAPGAKGNATAELLKILEAQAAVAHLAVRPLTRTDLFGSFGLIPVRTRPELRKIVGHLGADLALARIERQDALAEAAATAVVGDLAGEWPPI